MRLSRTAAYALQATLQLAQEEGDTPVPCSRLAAEGGMPERFLLQVLRNLVRHGILESTRGVDGGYRLERAADEISLLDVMEAVDGPMNTTLPLIEGLPERCKTKLAGVVTNVTELARRELEAVTLSHLLAPANGRLDH